MWIGSPVYANRAVPPVLDFISKLNPAGGAGAVPFVTFGGVTSGAGLADLSEGLTAQGFELLGAAKVVSEHSLMWPSPNPLGQGRPDEDDERLVAELTAKVLEKKTGTGAGILTAEDLNYHPAEHMEVFLNKRLADMKTHAPPKVLDSDLCTQCGLCAETCPTANIVLDPYPVIGDNCVFCFNCVRACAPEALTSAIFSAMEERLRGLAAKYREEPGAMIFVLKQGRAGPKCLPQTRSSSRRPRRMIISAWPG